MILIDMVLARLGLCRLKHANTWATQSSIYRLALTRLHHDTPHATVKKEIEDVLHQADRIQG